LEVVKWNLLLLVIKVPNALSLEKVYAEKSGVGLIKFIHGESQLGLSANSWIPNLLGSMYYIILSTWYASN